MNLQEITDSKGNKVADLFVTGKKAIVDFNGRVVKGAGFLQAVAGKYVHVSVIIKRSKPNKDGANYKQFLIGVNRIEWNDEGKTTLISGLKPFIETDVDEKWKLVSDLTKPTIKDGLLVLDIEQKGRVSIDIKFGDKGSVLGNADSLF